MSDPPKAASPETSSHIPIKPLYTPEDIEGSTPSYPGDYPYTRGVQATMYRGRLWTMRQYAGMGDAEESNKRYKYLLAQGTTGLSVAFDLPTQIGLDSDSVLALGEVGKVGVAIDSIEDMQRLFDGIDLTKISTSMTINATASILIGALCGRREPPGRADLENFRAPCRTTYSRNTSRAEPTFIRRSRPCASSPTCSPGPTTRFPSGIRFPSPATTCARQGRPPFRKWLSLWPTAWPTCRPPSTPDWTSTSSRHASPSFSTPTTISWKRSPSSAPPAACGRASCASISRPRTPVPGCCASIPRRPVRR